KQDTESLRLTNGLRGIFDPLAALAGLDLSAFGVMLRNEVKHEGAKTLRTCHTEENMQKLSSSVFAIVISIGIMAFAYESMAQSSDAPKKGTPLLTLGTRAGPFPTVGRAQSSNLLIVNGALYIVDAGPGVTRRLTRAAINTRDIDDIFITHAHDDHT